MRRFPERLVRLIREREPRESGHATKNRARLDLVWEDVVSIAETADWWTKERDELVPGDHKYRMIGRDTHGRRMYTAGKEMILDGEAVWFIITIHEAK